MEYCLMTLNKTTVNFVMSVEQDMVMDEETIMNIYIINHNEANK